MVDCPTCGAKGIARCSCFADVLCPAHVDRSKRNGRKVFPWYIIDQPGEYFRIVDNILYEDNADLVNEWTIIGETASGDGLVCRFRRTMVGG